MITVYVSPGPPNVAIPNVDGMSVLQAYDRLRALGFQVTTQQAGPFGRTVFNYSPSGQAPKGSTITIYYGLPNLRRGRARRAVARPYAMLLPCSGSFTSGMATGPRLGRSPARRCTDEAT